jgi:hypothetical protein
VALWDAARALLLVFIGFAVFASLMYLIFRP